MRAGPFVRGGLLGGYFILPPILCLDGKMFYGEYTRPDLLPGVCSIFRQPRQLWFHWKKGLKAFDPRIASTTLEQGRKSRCWEEVIRARSIRISWGKIPNPEFLVLTSRAHEIGGCGIRCSRGMCHSRDRRRSVHKPGPTILRVGIPFFPVCRSYTVVLAVYLLFSWCVSLKLDFLFRRPWLGSSGLLEREIIPQMECQWITVRDKGMR